MSKPRVLVSAHDLARPSYTTYITGFVVSLICTLSSYYLVRHHMVSRKWSIAYIVAALALVQFFIQLTLFLHLGREAKPKLRLLVFCFMMMVVMILIGGSIWIMQNLNERMTPTQMNNYMNSQDGGL
jgi:cytochrome o ubiquinol oxidase operon protein cyoD